jgi:asparagine synthase (glutamine-hydrolysing)
LKKVGRAWLPAPIIERKKQGFPMPMSLWFRGEARSFVRDLLSPATIRRRRLFNPEYVHTLLEEHEAGFADHGPLLWGLLSVEIWYRLFVDAAPSSSTRPAGLSGAVELAGTGRGGRSEG